MNAALSRRAAQARNAYPLFPDSINRRDFAYAVERADSFEDLSERYQQAILITEQPPEPKPEPEPEAEFANDCHDPSTGRFCETAAGAPGSPTDVIKVYGDSPTRNAVREALKAIESVHGLPEAIYRPALFRETQTDNPIGEYISGDYHHQGGVLEVSVKGSHPELTFTHEFGHYVDHQFYVSRNDVLPVIKKSFAYNQLESKKGQEFGYPDYLLDDKETFARAYAQYIAVRSGNQILLAQVDRPRHEFGAKGDSQWGDDDFTPIAEAFDSMFASKGLLKRTGTTASVLEEFYNTCHSPETGEFCKSAVEKGTAAEKKEARAAHKKKVLRAPVPTPEMVARGREILRKSREEGGRPGGDGRGTSKDRAIRQQKLWEEFGGPKRGYIVDPATGVKMHYSRDPKINPTNLPIFTQGKVFLTFQGGAYRMENLLPELLRSNQRRGDRPIRKENLE